MSTVSSITVEVRNSDGGDASAAYLSFSIPTVAKREMETIVREHGKDLQSFLHPIEESLNAKGGWPWAMVCFRSEFRLSGHLAMIRELKCRLPMACYSVRPPNGITGEDSVPPVSVLLVPRKGILQTLAPKSPLLMPVWQALRGCAEDQRWLCIPDAPAPEWVRKTAVGDGKRYLEARASEHSRLEAPGYESLESQEEYQMALVAASEGDAFSLHTHAQRFSKAFPHRPRGHLMLGDAYAAMHDSSSAIEHYREAISLERTRSRRLAASWLNRAAEWMDEESAEKDTCLVKAHRIATESSSDAAAAWMRLAATHADAGEMEKARSACESGIEWFPCSAPLHVLRLEVCEALGDLDAAVSAGFAGAQAADGDGYPWFRLGMLFLTVRNAAETIRCFDRSAAFAPDVSFPLSMLGLTHARQHDYGKGAEYCRKALCLDPEDAGAWNTLSHCCTRLGFVEDAIDGGRQAVRLCPNKHSWDTLGAAYSAAGRSPQAVKCLVRAITLDWEYGEAWYDLGVAYLRAGDRDRAASVLARLRQIDLAWTATLLDEFAPTPVSDGVVSPS